MQDFMLHLRPANGRAASFRAAQAAHHIRAVVRHEIPEIEWQEPLDFGTHDQVNIFRAPDQQVALQVERLAQVADGVVAEVIPLRG